MLPLLAAGKSGDTWPRRPQSKSGWPPPERSTTPDAHWNLWPGHHEDGAPRPGWDVRHHRRGEARAPRAARRRLHARLSGRARHQPHRPQSAVPEGPVGARAQRAADVGASAPTSHGLRLAAPILFPRRLAQAPPAHVVRGLGDWAGRQRCRQGQGEALLPASARSRGADADEGVAVAARFAARAVGLAARRPFAARQGPATTTLLDAAGQCGQRA